MAAKITTVEEARALPEIKDAHFYEVKRIDPVTHHTVIERHPRPFCAKGVSGDQILWFRDSDGRLMEVCYTEDGPAKAEMVI